MQKKTDQTRCSAVGQVGRVGRSAAILVVKVSEYEKGPAKDIPFPAKEEIGKRKNALTEIAIRNFLTVRFSR